MANRQTRQVEEVYTSDDQWRQQSRQEYFNMVEGKIDFLSALADKLDR